MRDLLARAADMGLEVHGAHIPRPRVGAYFRDLGRIYFDLDLTLPYRRTVIAHELGHAYYGHDCDSERNERQADKYAATLLINPEWYAELEQINPDAEWIADEMNVAPYAVVDYRRYCLQRIGNATYTRPRMGAGQWLHRIAVL